MKGAAMTTTPAATIARLQAEALRDQSTINRLAAALCEALGQKTADELAAANLGAGA